MAHTRKQKQKNKKAKKTTNSNSKTGIPHFTVRLYAVYSICVVLTYYLTLPYIRTQKSIMILIDSAWCKRVVFFSTTFMYRISFGLRRTYCYSR